MNTEIKVKASPTLEDPVIICGLPGSAFVGKFAIDHLISELEAQPLAEIYSEGFPPEVVISPDGTGSLMKNDIYYWQHGKGQASKRDLLFYTGDAQPSSAESEYALSEKVLDFLVQQHRAKELITLGAFVTGQESGQFPKVYSAATELALAQKMQTVGCELMGDGAITGMNGLLLGIARLKGLSGFTLLGETSGYRFDSKAPQAILSVLSKLLGIQLSYEKLEEKAKQAQEAMKTLQSLERGGGAQAGPGRKGRLDYIS